MPQVRQALVAGSFYPAEPYRLQAWLQQQLAVPSSSAAPALGLVVPHAGYVYSGAIAAAAFAQVAVPPVVVLLGPNHRGQGAPAALYDQGGWQTPLGPVAVDEALAAAVLAEVPGVAADPAAHAGEHSLEVMLPFLQWLRPDVRIVPLMLQAWSLADLLTMGQALASLLQRWPQPPLLLASSDMSHYVTATAARAQDLPVIERLLALDAAGLYRQVHQARVSMCGVYPVTLLLATLAGLGCRGGELVRYGHSGEVTGDEGSVVAYVSALFR